MKSRRFFLLFAALFLLSLSFFPNVSTVQAQGEPNRKPPPPLIITKLTIQLSEPATVGKFAIVSFLLTTGNGTPLSHKLLKVFVDDVRQTGVQTDANGQAIIHFRRDTTGTYMLMVTYNGDKQHELGPAVASAQVFVMPVIVELHAIPAIAGISFFLDDRIFITNQEGVAKIEVNQVGTYELKVLPLETPKPDIRVVFKRWGNDTYTPARTINIPMPDKPIEVGFEVSYQVSQTFGNQKGESVDSERINSITVKGSDGGGYTFENHEPQWLVANHVARLKNGLQETKILYYLMSVVIDGSNVVYESQQRFYVERNGVWPIKLLLYSIHFTAHDALFHFPTGSGIRLEYPNGKTQTFPFNATKQYEIEGLARGLYNVTLVGIRGMSSKTPIALSRDQEVDLKVLSLLDLSVVFSAGLMLALGLLVIGRMKSLSKLTVIRDRRLAWKKNKKDKYPMVPGFTYQTTADAVAIVASPEYVVPETSIRGEKEIPRSSETEALSFPRNKDHEILVTSLETKAVDAEPKFEKLSFSPSVAHTFDFVQSDNGSDLLSLPHEDQARTTPQDIHVPTCKVCGSSNIVKNGRNRHGNGQKYRCKTCGSYRIQKPTQIL